MRKLNAIVLAVIAVGFIVIAIGTAMVSNVSAVDNPCDPTYSMLKYCKTHGGHFSTACCCCVYH